MQAHLASRLQTAPRGHAELRRAAVQGVHKAVAACSFACWAQQVLHPLKAAPEAWRLHALRELPAKMPDQGSDL